MSTSAAPEIRIAQIKGSIPTCTPNLMPFHIAYAGPAPISTYFRVKPAPPLTYGKEATPRITPSSSGDSTPPSADAQTASGSSQSTLVASSSTASIPATSVTSLDTAVDVEMVEEGNSLLNTSKRFVAAFRGRIMQGLTVELPQGYAGIVLRTPDDGKDKHAGASRDVELEREKARDKGKKAGKRSTRRSRATEVDPGEDGDTGDFNMEAAWDHDAPSRVLEPTSSFSSFVLWHPDIPVDEGKDEYLRSLTDWTRLAAEIHRCED
ncbi:hypothetical protein SCP_1601780 [Sparassis crispa]|uniref:Uncharacterized protein n=1 Tax=Sparassis crispa TaxID=139825 RepID=A0A401H4Z2_9APHY|nr:hypothetical protein SCP_1601780 [Sparassis crispa]GBE89516.1 hypothetical protein SCP_1601780 [Sparassis crispa]